MLYLDVLVEVVTPGRTIYNLWLHITCGSVVTLTNCISTSVFCNGHDTLIKNALLATDPSKYSLWLSNVALTSVLWVLWSMRWFNSFHILCVRKNKRQLFQFLWIDIFSMMSTMLFVNKGPLIFQNKQICRRC